MSEKKHKLSDFNIDVKYDSIGSYLKETRIAKKLTIDDIVNSIRIRKNFIEALENNKYELLPERTYALGYLRVYANFLELPDVEKLIQFLDKSYNFNDPVYSEDDFYGNKPQEISLVDNKKQHNIENKNPSTKQKIDSKKNALNDSKYYLLGSFIFTCFIGVFLYVSFVNKDTEEEEVVENVKVEYKKDNTNINIADSNKFEKVDKKNLVLDEPKENEQEIKDEATNKMNSKNAFNDNPDKTDIIIQKFPQETIPRSITLLIKETVWIQIYNTDNPNIVYLDKIFQPQDVYNVPGIEKISMKVGNYKALDLKIDGVSYPLKSNKKNAIVLSNIALDKRTLLSLYGNN